MGVAFPENGVRTHGREKCIQLNLLFEPFPEPIQERTFQFNFWRSHWFECEACRLNIASQTRRINELSRLLRRSQ